jgi:type IX secretion system PorP/SprF family membrane protein
MKHMRIFMLVGLAGMSLNAFSQVDPRFLQPELTPLEINPAFAGWQPGLELNACHLSQWPGLSNGGFPTSFLAVNHRLDESPVGLGLTANREVSAAITTTNSTKLLGAYGLPLGEASELRMGLSAGAYKTHLDTTNLGYSIPEMLLENQFASLSAGMLLSTPRLTLGGSAWHVNEPNNSLLEGVTSTKDMRFQAHVAFDLPFIVKEDSVVTMSISPSAVRTWQGETHVTVVGVHANVHDQFRLGAMTIVHSFSGITTWGGSAGVRLRNVWLNYTYGHEAMLPHYGGSHQVNVLWSLGDLRTRRTPNDDDVDGTKEIPGSGAQEN